MAAAAWRWDSRHPARRLPGSPIARRLSTGMREAASSCTFVVSSLRLPPSQAQTASSPRQTLRRRRSTTVARSWTASAAPVPLAIRPMCQASKSNASSPVSIGSFAGVKLLDKPRAPRFARLRSKLSLAGVLLADFLDQDFQASDETPA